MIDIVVSEREETVTVGLEYSTAVLDDSAARVLMVSLSSKIRALILDAPSLSIDTFA